MKVILLYNELDNLTPESTSVTVNGIATRIRSVTTTIHPILTNVENPMEVFLQSLLINKDKANAANKKFWNLRVDVGISVSPIHPEKEIYAGTVKVQDTETGGILQKMSDFFGGHLKLKVDLFNVNVTNVNSGSTAMSFNTTEKLVQPSFVLGGNFAVEENDMIICKKHILCNAWKAPQCEYKGSLIITAITPDDIRITQDPNIIDVMSVNRKILTNEIAWDVTIIPGNGEAIKCHKSFLCAHSSVFQNMLQGDTKESQTNTVEIPDITEAAFRAFLTYLYGWDIEETTTNCCVNCSELFYAAHKYDVGRLEERLKDILLGKDNEWFDVDVAMKLFLYTRTIEARSDVKMKAVQVLKSKFSTLKLSACYNEIFEKDPQAAKELCEYAFSI